MLHHVAMSVHQPPRAAVSMAKTGELRRVGRRHPAYRLAYRFMERRIWILTRSTTVFLFLGSGT